MASLALDSWLGGARYDFLLVEQVLSSRELLFTSKICKSLLHPQGCWTMVVLAASASETEEEHQQSTESRSMVGG